MYQIIMNHLNITGSVDLFIDPSLVKLLNQDLQQIFVIYVLVEKNFGVLKNSSNIVSKNILISQNQFFVS